MSPVVRVQVNDLGELANNLRRLAEDWEEIAQTAMENALSSTGYLDEVWKRIPKSSRDRYAAAYKSIYSDDRKARNNKFNVREGVVKDGWREVLSSKALARLDQYGQENLAKSFMPGRSTDVGKVFKVKKGTRDVRLIISSSVAYAARMHRTDKPGEGVYWGRVPGGPGWTVEGTGNRYLEKPYEDLQDRILREFGYQIDRALKQRGLM